MSNLVDHWHSNPIIFKRAPDEVLHFVGFTREYQSSCTSSGNLSSNKALTCSSKPSSSSIFVLCLARPGPSLRTAEAPSWHSTFSTWAGQYFTLYKPLTSSRRSTTSSTLDSWASSLWLPSKLSHGYLSLNAVVTSINRASSLSIKFSPVCVTHKAPSASLSTSHPM